MTEGGPLHNEEGTLCRVVEFPPKTSSPFHRTISLDYGECRDQPIFPLLVLISGILCIGEITLELDDGAERKLSPGDVVVQRGT